MRCLYCGEGREAMTWKILWPIWALGYWGDTGEWRWPPPSPREAGEKP